MYKPDAVGFGMSKTVPGPETRNEIGVFAELDTHSASFVTETVPPPVMATAVGWEDAKVNLSSVRLAPGTMENVCTAPDVPVSRLMENGVASASIVTVCGALTRNDALSSVPGTPFGVHLPESAQRPSPPFQLYGVADATPQNNMNGQRTA